MTPGELAANEVRLVRGGGSVDEYADLVVTLREAWTERDEARAAAAVRDRNTTPDPLTARLAEALRALHPDIDFHIDCTLQHVPDFPTHCRCGASECAVWKACAVLAEYDRSTQQ